MLSPQRSFTAFNFGFLLLAILAVHTIETRKIPNLFINWRAWHVQVEYSELLSGPTSFSFSDPNKLRDEGSDVKLLLSPLVPFEILGSLVFRLLLDLYLLVLISFPRAFSPRVFRFPYPPPLFSPPFFYCISLLVLAGWLDPSAQQARRSLLYPSCLKPSAPDFLTVKSTN